MKCLPKIIACGLFSLSLLDVAAHAQDTFSAEETVVQKVTPEEPKTDARRVLKFNLDETRVIYDAPLKSQPSQCGSIFRPRQTASFSLSSRSMMAGGCSS